jgi:hypothetical protein
MSLSESLLLDPYRMDVYVANRADGVAGSGTQNDPFDGSTQPKFDAVMNSIATYTCVHLGPGIFKTNGYSDTTGGGWQPRTGTKIVGSGIDVTTLQLAGNVSSAHFYVIDHEIYVRKNVSASETVENGWKAVGVRRHTQLKVGC